MNEEKGFLDALMDEPHDRTTRLVYADWLDDHGRTEEANKHRLTARIHELGAPDEPHHIFSTMSRRNVLHRFAYVADFPGASHVRLVMYRPHYHNGRHQFEWGQVGDTFLRTRDDHRPDSAFGAPPGRIGGVSEGSLGGRPLTNNELGAWVRNLEQQKAEEQKKKTKLSRKEPLETPDDVRRFTPELNAAYWAAVNDPGRIERGDLTDTLYRKADIHDILADWLADRNDPRELLVRNRTSFADADRKATTAVGNGSPRMGSREHGPNHNPYGEENSNPHMIMRDKSDLEVYPHVGPKGRVFHVRWTPPADSHYGYNHVMTPHEFYHWVEGFPEGTRENIKHEMNQETYDFTGPPEKGEKQVKLARKPKKPTNTNGVFQFYDAIEGAKKRSRSPKQFMAQPEHDIFADWLNDHNDPREDLVRKRMEYSKADAAARKDTDSKFFGSNEVVGHVFPDGTNLLVIPHGHYSINHRKKNLVPAYPIDSVVANAISPGNPTEYHRVRPNRLFHVGWDGPAQRWYSTVMTPHEFYRWVDRFPEQEANRLRATFTNNEHTQPPGPEEQEPTRLARLKAPAGGAIVNNQYQQGGQFLPRAFRRIRRVVQEHERQRRIESVRKNVGQLKLKLIPGESIFEGIPKEKPPTQRPYAQQYRRNLLASVGNRQGLLPSVEEIKSLAQAGRSVRGQYQNAYRVMSRLLGHHDATLFTAANAILSPRSAWEQHSRAAMRALRLWHEAGRPTDPKLVGPLMDKMWDEKTRDGKRIIDMLSTNKVAKLVRLFTNPDKYVKDLGHVSSTGFGKIVDFAGAFKGKKFSPLDTHMAKALVPGVRRLREAVIEAYTPTSKDDEKTARMKRAMGKKALEQFQQLREAVKKLGPVSSTAHVLATKIAEGHEGTHLLPKALLLAQQNVLASDTLYRAYKAAVGQAAHELNWEPREVQEAAWAAVVSIVAAKNLDIPAREILSRLKHEDVFHAWNVGGLLTTPELTHDFLQFGLSPRHLADFRREANRKPHEESGSISGVNAPAFETVASRIPANRGATGAFVPVEAAIRAREAGPKAGPV